MQSLLILHSFVAIDILDTYAAYINNRNAIIYRYRKRASFCWNQSQGPCCWPYVSYLVSGKQHVSGCNNYISHKKSYGFFAFLFLNWKRFCFVFSSLVVMLAIYICYLSGFFCCLFAQTTFVWKDARQSTVNRQDIEKLPDNSCRYEWRNKREKESELQLRPKKFPFRNYKLLRFQIRIRQKISIPKKNDKKNKTKQFHQKRTHSFCKIWLMPKS